LNYEECIVNTEWITREDTYNLIIGGITGVKSVNNKRSLFKKKTEPVFAFKKDMPVQKQRYFRTNLTWQEIIDNYRVGLNVNNPELRDIYNQIFATQCIGISEQLTKMWNDQRFHNEAIKYFESYKKEGEGKMKLVKGSMLNTLEAIAEARKQLDALPQDTVVVITKKMQKYFTHEPIYSVYATLGGLEAGQIIES